MSVTDGAIKLKTAYKNLSEAWQATQGDWNDRVRDDFEENYLETLRRQVESTLREMDRLGEALAGARRQCEDS